MLFRVLCQLVDRGFRELATATGRTSGRDTVETIGAVTTGSATVGSGKGGISRVIGAFSFFPYTLVAMGRIGLVMG